MNVNRLVRSLATALLAVLLLGLGGAQREIVIAQGIDVPGFDPHGHHTTAVEAVLVNIFDYLVFRDADGTLEPSLAVAWEPVADDAWRFELREGVVWHDGEPFTGEDVKFTLERVATDSGLQPYDSYRQIREVEVLGDHEIVIHTHGPDPLLLNRISRLSSGIAPRHYVEEVGWETFATDPIGTGPYRFVEWRRDDRVILEAFDDHWRGRPAFDRVVHRTIPEDSTRVAELIAGGVHIATNVPPQDRDRVTATGAIEVVLQPTTRIMMLIFNTHEDALTGDPRIREAIELAIDNQLLVEAVMDGLGVPTRARVSPGIGGSPLELWDDYTFDPERAVELIREAGYEPGDITIKVEGPAGRYPLDAELAQVIALMLDQIGVNTEIEVLEWSAYQSRIWDADNITHFVLMGLANSMFDNWFSMRAIQCEGAYRNRVHWCNERFDELMSLAETEVDLDQRTDYLTEATYLVLEERPWVTLFQGQVLVGIAGDVSWQPRQDELLWMYAATPFD
jgi:peptide/nickel transport system substrate-binding protein